MFTAHLFTGKRNGLKVMELIIGNDGDISSDAIEETHEVGDKKEARQIAASIGAKCWNF